MLLALDVGNTNVTVGVFDEQKLINHWRLRTVHEQTADEWGILLRNLFTLCGIESGRIDGLIISSVVPVLDSILAEMSLRYFGTSAMFITPESKTGLKILYENPKEVGADRVVNAVAAHQKYGGPCVIVDLGTAITFDAVTTNGEYMGGVICPGIGISMAGLVSRTARLPMVDFREPNRLIGSNTVGSIQSGLYYGTIGMIDGIVERMIGVLGPHTKTIATGGHARLITKGSRYVRILDEYLTLEGLRILWARK